MKLQPADRARITRKIGGHDDIDAVVACNIIEALCNKMCPSGSGHKLSAPLNYDLDTTTFNDRFTIRFTGGIDVFTHEYAQAIMRQSLNVCDVVVDFGAKTVSVTVMRMASDGVQLTHDPVRYVPAAKTKKRRIATDYAAGGVVSKDDCQNIDSIVYDAYHVNNGRVPADMLFWYEPVTVTAGSAFLSKAHGGAAVPFSDDMTTNDESVSEAVAAGGGGGGDVVGYSLCFSKPPPLSCSFFDYLHSKYTSIVASSYAWLHVPHNEPLLVVNIRSASVAASDVKHVVTGNLPAGIAPRRTKKRIKHGL